MANELITQVRQVHSQLKEVSSSISVYQDLDGSNLPQWAEWEYYRLVDLVTTATLVAHRLEQMLEEHQRRSK